MSKITEVHIFSPGTQTSAAGVTREFTKDDLQQVADSYNKEVHEAPIRVGHDDSDRVPSWGWVKGVKLKGEDLYAEVEFTPQMGGFIRDGLYKKVSASFYAPGSKINPSPGEWSLRHVAMLGAQPPAVKGLKGFAYSESTGTLDFATGVDLSPEQVFDEELGPTLTVDQQPMEFLKEQLEEARQQMKEEAAREVEVDEIMDPTAEISEEERPDSDFAEEEGMKKKPSKAKQGAEDADEEEEGEDTVDSKELPPALKKNMEKKKAEAKGDDEEEEEDTSDNMEATFEPGKKKRGHDSDKSSDVGVKADSEYEEKMDPVGKEDGDIDNDGDKDSSDEYLAKRRKAISASIKKDKKADYAEEDSVDHKGCGDHTEDYAGSCGSKKKNYKEGEDEAKHAEISVPEGVDATQWEAGFKDGVDKFYAAAEAGEDEVLHEEADDQTEDYLAGIEAGFEFAQGKLSNLKDTAFGVDKTGKGKDCHSPECLEGKGESDTRDQKGKGKKGEMDNAAYDAKGKDGSQEADRKKVGKSKDVQTDGKEDKTESTGDASGSGKQIKGKGVRVMKFAEADFSEMVSRLEQLEAANAKLVAEKAAAEAAAHRLQLNDFAESLYATGRLTEAVIEQDELVDYMEGLENGTIEFSEGVTPATKLMEILAALPQQVEFSEVAGHDPEAVPVENLNPHERALRMSQEGAMSYTEALKQTLFSAE